MEVEVVQGACRILRLVGVVDLTNANELELALEEAVRESPKGLIVDLSKTQYIDSAGIAKLLSAYRQLQHTHGALALILVPGNVKRIISLIHPEMLPGIFVCDDLASAEKVLSCQSGSASQ